MKTKNEKSEVQAPVMYMNGAFSTWAGGRKPKGWYRRYELRWRETLIYPGMEWERREFRWTISQCIGSKDSPFCFRSFGDVGARRDTSDVDLVRRCKVDDVTVPVIIFRDPHSPLAQRLAEKGGVK